MNYKDTSSKNKNTYSQDIYSQDAYYQDIYYNYTCYKDIPVLVTGGAGFIGSHLVKALIKAQAKVTILDNLSTGSLDNLKSVLDKIRFIEGSITDFDTCLQATFNQYRVFHCAAKTIVPDCTQNPDLCYQANITGTYNILHASYTNKVDTVIFSSSSAVYGEAKTQSHEASLCNPISTYGYSKLIGESLCKQYSTIYNLNTIILRYFNVYHQDQYLYTLSNVTSHFKHNMYNNLPIILYGDGTQTRDFVHVDYVVKANLLTGFMPLKNRYELFNIASGKHVSLLELINRLKKEFPAYNKEIVFKSSRIGDIMHSRAECSKFKTLEHKLESHALENNFFLLLSKAIQKYAP